MDGVATIAVILVGAIRALTGVWFVATPSKPAQAWVGQSDLAVAYLTRAVGGRDLVIGLGILASAFIDVDAVPWLLASIGADLVDATAAAVMLDGTYRRNTLFMATGFAALGLIAITFTIAA